MYASAFRASPNTTITLNNTAAVLRFGISLVKALWKLVPSQTRRRQAPHTQKYASLPTTTYDVGNNAPDGGSGWARTNDPRLIKTVL